MNNNQNVALNDAIKIDINKTVIIDDLSITLTDFAHKMTIDDKVATGIAHITITKGSVSEATIISSDTNQQDMSEQYEAIRWNNYIIALEALDYEKSITVTVSKK